MADGGGEKEGEKRRERLSRIFSIISYVSPRHLFTQFNFTV